MSGGQEESVEKRKRFWSWVAVAVLSLVVLQMVLYFTGHISFWRLTGGILAVLAGVLVSFGVRRLQLSLGRMDKIQLMNRIAFIGGFGGIAWMMMFFGGQFIIKWATGSVLAGYVGPELALFIIFVAPWIVGGLIGYLVGNRRNYQPYI